MFSKSFDFSEVYSVAHLVAIRGTSTKNIPFESSIFETPAALVGPLGKAPLCITKQKQKSDMVTLCFKLPNSTCSSRLTEWICKNAPAAKHGANTCLKGLPAAEQMHRAENESSRTNQPCPESWTHLRYESWIQSSRIWKRWSWLLGFLCCIVDFMRGPKAFWDELSLV